MNITYFTRKKIRTTDELEIMCLPYIDVTVLLAGVMRYTMNQKVIELHAGDVIVFQPGDIRTRESSGPTEYYSFNVLIDEGDSLPLFHGVLTNCVNDDIRTLLCLYESCDAFYSTYAQEKCRHCFSMLYYTLYEISYESKKDTYVSKIKQCIAEHIQEPITLSQISSEVFLSPNYCNYLFKSQTGNTITEYILRMKMERATYLMLNTNMALTDISLSLGYKEYSYFSRMFKKVMNVSPVYFRKRYIFSNPIMPDNIE